MAWLHSFMYEDAIDAFRAAQKIDPNFAMAYWGEAMSFSQPLWFFEEVPQGRAALAKLGPTPEARIAKAKTAREQAFMRAVEALFGAGDTTARHAAYEGIMSKLAVEELFALGLSAVNLGDAARVRTVIREFRKAAAPTQSAALREQAEIMLREMEALDLTRFDRVLARTPNRSRALLGLARAYRNAGDATNARAAYQRFLTNYRQADPGLPEVAEAMDAVR